MRDTELWHHVEARREDGAPAIFRIRELDARLEQPHIFVVELPYPLTELSRLPDATGYRRFDVFKEQWLDPACLALSWTPVAIKIEDGSFFVYLYGATDPQQLVERLSPFDGALGFFDEADPNWENYAHLREVLDEAKQMPRSEPIDEAPVLQMLADADIEAIAASMDHTKTTTPIRALSRKAASKPKSKKAAKSKTKAKPKKAKPKPKKKSSRR